MFNNINPLTSMRNFFNSAADALKSSKGDAKAASAAGAITGSSTSSGKIAKLDTNQLSTPDRTLIPGEKAIKNMLKAVADKTGISAKIREFKDERQMFKELSLNRKLNKLEIQRETNLGRMARNEAAQANATPQAKATEPPSREEPTRLESLYTALGKLKDADYIEFYKKEMADVVAKNPEQLQEIESLSSAEKNRIPMKEIAKAVMDVQTDPAAALALVKNSYTAYLQTDNIANSSALRGSDDFCTCMLQAYQERFVNDELKQFLSPILIDIPNPIKTPGKLLERLNQELNANPPPNLLALGQMFKELKGKATRHQTETANVLSTIVPLRVLFSTITIQGAQLNQDTQPNQGAQPKISTAMSQLLQQATNLNGNYAKMLEKESSVIRNLEIIMGKEFPGTGGQTMDSNSEAAEAWKQFQTDYNQYWPGVQKHLGL